MAIEVLETMSDECVVAGRSAKLLQKALARAAATRHQQDSERLAGTLLSMSSAGQQQHHHHQQQQQQQQQQHQQQHQHLMTTNTTQATNHLPIAGAAAALTPAESDHGGPAAVGSAAGPWPDPTMGINWMHCWAPVNLLDNEMLDFDLNMPYMGFESGDHLGQSPG